MNCSTLPCSSLSPWVCSNSYPLNQWCHPTISSSVAPFSSCPQSFPASGYFPMSCIFASDGQSIGTSASASVLPNEYSELIPLELISLIWELDCEESWVLKNWCFWTMVSEKTLESPLDCKEIQTVHPKGDQSWVFIGKTDAEAETPVLWPLDAKSWLTGKDPDAGRDCGQEEKGTTEDEMAGWHHRLDGHRFG